MTLPELVNDRFVPENGLRVIVQVPVSHAQRIAFFLGTDEAKAVQVIKSIYSTHPYEEPVVFVESCVRTLHIRGVDENNPNRFWNNEPEDWVPDEHR